MSEQGIASSFLPRRTAVSVRIDETDRAVRLTVAPGHSVAGLAAAATIAVTVTFALSSSASAGSRFVALDLLVCAGVGIAVGRDAAPWRRVGAAAGLGLLAVFVGLLRIPALSHGVVLSPLPATATRVLVVLALCAGAGAIAAAAVASSGPRR